MTVRVGLRRGGCPNRGLSAGPWRTVLRGFVDKPCSTASWR